MVFQIAISSNHRGCTLWYTINTLTRCFDYCWLKRLWKYLLLIRLIITIYKINLYHKVHHRNTWMRYSWDYRYNCKCDLYYIFMTRVRLIKVVTTCIYPIEATSSTAAAEVATFVSLCHFSCYSSLSLCISISAVSLPLPPSNSLCPSLSLYVCLSISVWLRCTLPKRDRNRGWGVGSRRKRGGEGKVATPLRSVLHVGGSELI